MTTEPHPTTGPGPGPGEPALVTRARQRDPEAFGELYRLHHASITAYIAHRVTSNPALTEDLTADVFVKAWDKISTFQWTGTPIRAWLCTIARNIVADHYKTAATRRLTYTDHIHRVSNTWTTPATTAEDTVLAALDIAHLHHTLTHITPRQRTVLHHRYLAEMTIHETAQTMGTTTGAVKTLQWRALDSLRKHYTGATS